MYLKLTNLYTACIFLDWNINILRSPSTSCRAWYSFIAVINLWLQSCR